ncbi:SSU ribosomal protein S6p [Vulgatibacter incomptus]|uniref:Small ribosomal subunit protein bS6 n=1 Tax=Vulgatibacter incomptus TaxID=1391653 RepID=A0A0K1PEG4_9BACT|nr:SSU ribosomal protein S6p [Vulgatibacter incomptus]
MAAAPVAKVHASKDTRREYETIYLVRQDLTSDQLDKIKDRIKGIVDREGGRVIKVTTWGKKKTAFLVGNKQARAVYVHVNYLGQGRAVSEVERNLRNIEEVIKFQTIKLSDAVLPESRPTEEDVVLEGDREEEQRPAREEERGSRGERERDREREREPEGRGEEGEEEEAD